MTPASAVSTGAPPVGALDVAEVVLLVVLELDVVVAGFVVVAIAPIGVAG